MPDIEPVESDDTGVAIWTVVAVAVAVVSAQRACLVSDSRGHDCGNRGSPGRGIESRWTRSRCDRWDDDDPR